MRCKFIYFYFFLLNVYVETNNNFIVSFFEYKKSSSVVGFSCNINIDDVILLKNFNNKGILTTLNKLNNETKISLLAKTKYRKVGIFLDTRCYNQENVASIFLEASEYMMFDDLHHWLILGPDLEFVLRLIEESTFDLSTDFVIADMSDIENHQLYDVYNSFKERGTITNVTFMGNWSEKSKLNVSLKQEKFLRRTNFHGITLRAMFFKSVYRPKDMPLEEYLLDYSDSTKDARSKFSFQLLNHLADIYNFSLNLFESEEWEVGDTLGPVAKALQNKRADISGSPLIMNDERSMIIKFVQQVYFIRTCFIFRNPQPTDIKIETIFRPYHKSVWYLTILFIILASMVLWIVFQFEGIDNRIISLSNSFIVVFGALCQQGTDMKINHTSTRIAFLFIMIFSLLMYNYYSARVVYARLGQPIYKINDSLKELSKLNLKMSSEWMVYLQFFFNTPDRETQKFYLNHWLKIPEEKRFMNPEIGVRLVKKGGFAYHSHPEVSYPYIDRIFDNREICELMEVNLGRPSMTSFGVPLNSSFTEFSKIGLTKISEVGLRSRQTIRWQYKRTQCRKDLLSASSITIYEFAAHLILLMMGILVAVTGCMIEIFIAKRNDYIK